MVRERERERKEGGGKGGRSGGKRRRAIDEFIGVLLVYWVGFCLFVLSLLLEIVLCCSPG